MKVEAEVVCITTDAPRTTDEIWVDANVWFWTTYSRASSIDARPYQVTEYPIFLKKAKRNGAHLYWTAGAVAELAHTIERAELEIFRSATGTKGSNGDHLQIKEFRYSYPAERTAVTSEIQAAWGSIKTLGGDLGVHLAEAIVDSGVNRLITTMLDGYDALSVAALQSKGITQVLTDDKDFASMPGIQVFTANHKIIEAARKAHRLVNRPPLKAKRTT